MAISLVKGQTIDLSKKENDLTSLTIGLGWKTKKKGFLASLTSNTDFDLDAIAFLLDKNGKVANTGNDRLIGSDIVFFNNQRHHSGHVYSTGDNLVGGGGVQDDEQIIVKLDALDSRYDKILFMVCIYQGKQKSQTFGDIEKAYMRAVDNKGNEIARYDLADDASFQQYRTVVFGEVYRHGGGWKFRAIGDGDPTDTFVDILRRHLN